MNRKKRPQKKQTRPPLPKSGQNGKKKQGATGREKGAPAENRPGGMWAHGVTDKRDPAFEHGQRQEVEGANPHKVASPEPPEPPRKDPPAKPPGSIAVAETQVRTAAREGRPPKLTPEVHAAIMLAISMGMPEIRVGPLIRMDKSIVGKWKDRGRAAINGWAEFTPEQQLLERPYVEFFDDLMAAMPKFELSCLAIMQAAKNAGDARIADRLLQIKFPEYRTKVAMVGGDPEDPPVVTQDAGPMPEAERVARAKRARDILAAMENGS